MAMRPEFPAPRGGVQAGTAAKTAGVVQDVALQRALARSPRKPANGYHAMADGPAAVRDIPLARSRPAPIEIGLVNNMPDGALLATERQFQGLLQAVSGDFDVSLHLFSLAGVPRGEAATSAMNGRYAKVSSLEGLKLDALIVTGNEPRAADLREEPYWPEMSWLIDWAEANTLTTLWSCLAAHAAVLHLDGIKRQPLVRKCSGVFACEQVADDPMMAGIPAMIRMPHSRKNTLAVSDLVAGGYHLLTQSRDVGADLFIRRGRSQFIFFQGHPEYDADGLLKEYCRDFGRHMRGEAQEAPLPPSGYFDTVTENAFLALAQEARRRPSLDLIARCGEIASDFHPPLPWRPHAEGLYRNWLKGIAQMKAFGQASPCGQSNA
jgi:homoserine O-succinyltransferase